MDPSTRIARDLKIRGLAEVSAQLLELAGPLTWVSAQLAYICAPWFGGRQGWLQDLARVLEDPERCRQLRERLRAGGELG